MKKRYTHLFFDLDNTLWDFDTNAFHAMRHAFTCYGKHFNSLNFELFFQVFKKYNHLLWEDYRQGKVQKKELIRLRFEQTFKELKISGIDPVQMNELYLNEMPKQKRLVPGTVHLLDYLKSKGYKLFIITNGFMQVQHEKLEASGIKSYFTKIFISEVIKAPKPAREIFDYAIRSANARKTTSLMIGDDFESDILGALAYGIDAIYLTGQGKHNPDSLAGLKNFTNSYCQSASLAGIRQFV